MFKSLLYATALSALLVVFSTAAMAQNAQTPKPEADSEKAYINFSNNADKGTVVLKVNKDGSMAIMNIDHVPKNDAEAQSLAKNGKFIPVEPSKIVAQDKLLTESDKTAGISSWGVSRGFGWGHGFRGNSGYASFGQRGYFGGGYYGGGYAYGGSYNFYPPTYYYNTGFYDPCYSWDSPNYGAQYYYYNNVGWNTTWYPPFYSGYGYGRGGFYHRWR
jgi:hypothetical protein